MIDKQTKDITFGEFQHWMNGLIEGKRGQLPDVDDWKRIKAMMDRVKPDVETVTIPSIAPYIPPYDTKPWFDPNPYSPTIDPHWPNEIWCGTSVSNVGTGLVDPSIETGNGHSLNSFTSVMDTINKLKATEL